ncbi:MAG: metalloregulator ArsR/SmtB family transcription factor [Acidobacteriota bacterium]
MKGDSSDPQSAASADTASADPGSANPAQSEASFCAGVLQVLGNETRLAVVGRLMDGPRPVGEINRTLGVEQSLLSHHLKVLRDAGLVTATREGKQVIYALAREVQGRRSGRALHLGCCQISFD